MMMTQVINDEGSQHLCRPRLCGSGDFSLDRPPCLSLSSAMTFSRSPGGTPVTARFLLFFSPRGQGLHLPSHRVPRVLMVLSPCSTSKHALGSHEYIQYCRKFDIDIRLQLMEQKAVRSDLARTVRAEAGGGSGWLHGGGRVEWAEGDRSRVGALG